MNNEVSHIRVLFSCVSGSSFFNMAYLIFVLYYICNVQMRYNHIRVRPPNEQVYELL